MNEGHIIIKNTLVSAPDAPGIYQMFGGEGEILYIGKAKNLKNRLKNYISNQLTTRIMHLISNVRKLEYITTLNESEALLLESRLIKKHQPKYNVLLKDDKSFPYIKLRSDHDFPQIIKYRGKVTKDSQYFGPFANVGEVNRVLTFLHKTFKLRNCTDNYFAERKRPCLQYQIGRCSAPCVGKISKDDYQVSINEATQFLKGNNLQLQKNLSKQMDEASRDEDYEQAASIRDKIKNLSYIQTESDNHISILHSADVIAAVATSGIICISVSFYRFGQFYGHKLFFTSESENDISIALSSFIGTFYQDIPIPDEIIISQTIEDEELILTALQQIHNISTKITVPTKGGKKSLVKKAEETAHDGLMQKVKHDGVSKQIYDEIAEVFHLPKAPGRIEIYDNSHIMGTSAIGAFVVAGVSGFQKREYRYYNVENTIGDDYAMLREVLTRRLSKLREDDGKKPDLILIDGGKGQLSVAIDVMHKLEIDIPVAAIAKGAQRNAGRETFYLPSGEEFTFDRNKPLMKYLQILRDEAHNFAITTHRKKRARAMNISSLDEVADIGPVKKKALLSHFGSIDAIKSASIEEIAKVPGISKALAKAILCEILS